MESSNRLKRISIRRDSPERRPVVVMSIVRSSMSRTDQSIAQGGGGVRMLPLVHAGIYRCSVAGVLILSAATLRMIRPSGPMGRW